MRLSAFWGLTAMVVSFCGVVQPKFEKPLLFVASPMIASTSVDASGAYAPAGVLNGVERQSPAAASGASSSSSSPSIAHGALIVGSNFHLCVVVVAALDPPAITDMATTAHVAAKSTARLRLTNPLLVRSLPIARPAGSLTLDPSAAAGNPVTKLAKWRSPGPRDGQPGARGPARPALVGSAAASKLTLDVDRLSLVASLVVVRDDHQPERG